MQLVIFKTESHVSNGDCVHMRRTQTVGDKSMACQSVVGPLECMHTLYDMAYVQHMR